MCGCCLFFVLFFNLLIIIIFGFFKYFKYLTSQDHVDCLYFSYTLVRDRSF